MWITTRAVWDWAGNLLESEGYEYNGPVARCDRAAQNMAQSNENSAKGMFSQLGGRASDTYNALVPALKQDINQAPGMGSNNLANLIGSEAMGASGVADKIAHQQALRAARTGNAAGQGAVDVGAAENAGQALTSGINKGIVENADLQAQQRAQALSGLGNLYGTNLRGQESAMNAANQASEDYTKAGQSGWFQNLMGGLDVASKFLPGGNIMKLFSQAKPGAAPGGGG